MNEKLAGNTPPLPPRGASASRVLCKSRDGGSIHWHVIVGAAMARPGAV